MVDEPDPEAPGARSSGDPVPGEPASGEPGSADAAGQRAWIVRDALAWIIERFTRAGLEQPRLDAEHLMAACLGVDRFALYVSHARELGSDARAQLREFVRRRLAREPVAYIVGLRGFHALDLELRVDERVLVPRPDTETLVDWLLEELPPRPAPPFAVLDVGTGSGAIALATARARSDAETIGIDVSADALEVARGNAERLGLPATFERADLRTELPALLGRLGPHLHAVAANLPYVPTAELDTLAPEVARWEPRLALDGGPDGLDLVRALVRGLAVEARAGVRLYLEVAADQAGEAAALLGGMGYTEVAVRRDLGGRPRVVRGITPGSPKTGAGRRGTPA
jgi:release factor glutamine methyltransferase